MKKILAVASAFTAVLLVSQQVTAQIKTDDLGGQVNTITTAVPFLMITPDSRAGGMGDAGVASSPDANSVHWNAAKLAFIDKKMGFSISYTPWLRQLVNDINLSYVSGYYKLNDKSAVALSMRYFSLGNITFTNIAGENVGDYHPNEFALDGSYALKISDEFSAAVGLRYIRSDLSNGIDNNGNAAHAGTSVAGDVSAYYNKPIDLNGKDALVTLGLAITNIGTKISYTDNGVKDFIPTNLRLGGGLKYNLDEYNSIAGILEINKLLVPTPNPNDTVGGKSARPDVSVASGIFGSFSDAPDGSKEELKEVNYSIGAEYWYDNQFAVRAGYFHEDKTKGNRQYFNMGVGIRYNVFGVDFAYLIPTSKSVTSPLQNTLRFSILFNFDSGSGKSGKATDGPGGTATGSPSSN